MGHDKYHTDARVYAYDLWAQMHEDLPADHNGHTPDLDVAGRIAAQVRARFPDRAYRDGRSPYGARDILEWLTYESTYSPHIDDTAVDRACRFDRDVYVSLTRDERRTVWARLAATPDAFRDVDALEGWPVGERTALERAVERRKTWVTRAVAA